MHGYICECDNQHCKLRVYLSPLVWDSVSRHGRVIAKGCPNALLARRHGDVLDEGIGFVVVRGNVGSVAA